MTDDVIQIWLDVNRESHNFIPCTYWEKSIKKTKTELSELNVYVYDSNGVVKGFVGVTDDAHIAGIFVDKAYRREGIGTMLLNKCKEEYGKLTSEVYMKNEKAIEFYKKLGFKPYKHQVDKGNLQREYVMKWIADN